MNRALYRCFWPSSFHKSLLMILHVFCHSSILQNTLSCSRRLCLVCSVSQSHYACRTSSHHRTMHRSSSTSEFLYLIVNVMYVQHYWKHHLIFPGRNSTITKLYLIQTLKLKYCTLHIHINIYSYCFESWWWVVIPGTIQQMQYPPHKTELQAGPCM